MPSKRLILLGAGHTHLLLTERLCALREAGIDPLLIAPRWFDYSGLATAVLSGALPAAANRIDVAALAKRRGLAFVEGRAATVDPAAKSVRLEDGSAEAYDLLSLNIGSAVDTAIAGGDGTWLVKPLAELTRLRERVESTLSRSPATIVVAGAGPTGTEVAASMAGLFERYGAAAAIALVGKPTRSTGWNGLYRSLERRGVSMIDDEVIARLANGARLRDGRTLACDHLIAATGLRANALIRAVPVAHGPTGGIAVAATLQSVTDPALFASGDCADFLPRSLPKHGVFGVRQAPVLARNLIAAARGEPLVPYRPQRRWLAIMDLGNREGFATWGPLAWRGRAALALKRRLDLDFVRRFQC